MARNWCSQHPQYDIWFLPIVFSADCHHFFVIVPRLSEVSSFLQSENETIGIVQYTSSLRECEKNSWCHWRDIDKSSYYPVNYLHKSSHDAPLYSSIWNKGDLFLPLLPYIKWQSIRIQSEVLSTPRSSHSTLNETVLSLVICLSDNHFDLRNYKIWAFQSCTWGSYRKENSKGDKYNNLVCCLPSVTGSAAGEKVKHTLYFKPFVIILFSMGHISFVPENLQMVKIFKW